MKILGILFILIAGGGLCEMIHDVNNGDDFDEMLCASVIFVAVVGVALIMI
ncbi:MAG: hypothetical protein II670_13190 [Alphaproteobacteria bacterium]|nr:hypothetical protein [Alphaproteobacteria bacterium]